MVDLTDEERAALAKIGQPSSSAVTADGLTPEEADAFSRVGSVAWDRKALRNVGREKLSMLGKLGVDVARAIPDVVMAVPSVLRGIASIAPMAGKGVGLFAEKWLGMGDGISKGADEVEAFIDRHTPEAAKVEYLKKVLEQYGVIPEDYEAENSLDSLQKGVIKGLAMAPQFLIAPNVPKGIKGADTVRKVIEGAVPLESLAGSVTPIRAAAQALGEKTPWAQVVSNELVGNTNRAGALLGGVGAGLGQEIGTYASPDSALGPALSVAGGLVGGIGGLVAAGAQRMHNLRYGTKSQAGALALANEAVGQNLDEPARKAALRDIDAGEARRTDANFIAPEKTAIAEALDPSEIETSPLAMVHQGLADTTAGKAKAREFKKAMYGENGLGSPEDAALLNAGLGDAQKLMRAEATSQASADALPLNQAQSAREAAALSAANDLQQAQDLTNAYIRSRGEGLTNNLMDSHLESITSARQAAEDLAAMQGVMRNQVDSLTAATERNLNMSQAQRALNATLEEDAYNQAKLGILGNTLPASMASKSLHDAMVNAYQQVKAQAGSALDNASTTPLHATVVDPIIKKLDAARTAFLTGKNEGSAAYNEAAMALGKVMDGILERTSRASNKSPILNELGMPIPKSIYGTTTVTPAYLDNLIQSEFNNPLYTALRSDKRAIADAKKAYADALTSSGHPDLINLATTRAAYGERVASLGDLLNLEARPEAAYFKNIDPDVVRLVQGLTAQGATGLPEKLQAVVMRDYAERVNAGVHPTKALQETMDRFEIPSVQATQPNTAQERIARGAPAFSLVDPVANEASALSKVYGAMEAAKTTAATGEQYTNQRLAALGQDRERLLSGLGKGDADVLNSLAAEAQNAGIAKPMPSYFEEAARQGELADLSNKYTNQRIASVESETGDLLGLVKNQDPARAAELDYYAGQAGVKQPIGDLAKTVKTAEETAKTGAEYTKSRLDIIESKLNKDLGLVGGAEGNNAPIEVMRKIIAGGDRAELNRVMELAKASGQEAVVQKSIVGAVRQTLADALESKTIPGGLQTTLTPYYAALRQAGADPRLAKNLERTVNSIIGYATKAGGSVDVAHLVASLRKDESPILRGLLGGRKGVAVKAVADMMGADYSGVNRVMADAMYDPKLAKFLFDYKGTNPEHLLHSLARVASTAPFYAKDKRNASYARGAAKDEFGELMQLRNVGGNAPDVIQ